MAPGSLMGWLLLWLLLLKGKELEEGVKKGVKGEKEKRKEEIYFTSFPFSFSPLAPGI